MIRIMKIIAMRKILQSYLGNSWVNDCNVHTYFLHGLLTFYRKAKSLF